MFKILVVEDDKELNKTVCSFLNHSGYEATGCLNAGDAYDAMYDNMFDLIISDIMMPGVDGFEFARNVRELNEDIPILFMTARDDIASKQRGFRIGVDDYMVKPIDLDELFLRIGALLRRAKIASSRKLEIGSFVMDADEHTAYLGNEEISLTNREFSILAEDVKVEADAELLSLVWNNLFSNAFKFTEEGGSVSLQLTASEHHAIIKVKDTGCGMTAEVGAHIFEKFYQGDTSHSVQGNGLGLALVKRVIDILQGEIGVESVVGVGTTFTVKIRRL